MHKKITSDSESQHCHLLDVVICVTWGHRQRTTEECWLDS